MPRRLLVACVLCAALAGCGGTSDKGPGHPVSGGAAATQLRTLTDKLDRALADYRDGDRAGATSRFDAARAAHFTPARSALRRADRALAARLDGALSRDLPRLLRSGVPVTALARALAVVEDDLRRAEAELRRS